MKNTQTKFCLPKKIFYGALGLLIVLTIPLLFSYVSNKQHISSSQAGSFSCLGKAEWNTEANSYRYPYEMCCAKNSVSVCIQPYWEWISTLKGGYYSLDCKTKQLSIQETCGPSLLPPTLSPPLPSSTPIPTKKLMEPTSTPILSTAIVQEDVDYVKDVVLKKIDDFTYTLTISQLNNKKLTDYLLRIELIKEDKYNFTDERKCKTYNRTLQNQRGRITLRNALVIITFDDETATLIVKNYGSEKIVFNETIDFVWKHLKYINVDIEALSQTNDFSKLRLCIEQ